MNALEIEPHGTISPLPYRLYLLGPLYTLF
jgi:hypothetical protein